MIRFTRIAALLGPPLALATAALLLAPGRGRAQDTQPDSSVARQAFPGTHFPSASGVEPAAISPATIGPAAIDSAGEDPALLLHQRLRQAERDHLVRVGVWGMANAAAGTAMALAVDRGERPTVHAFGIQTAGWGVVNTGIAAAGLLFGGRGDPPSTPGEALRSESHWGQILVLNQGLNVGYAMTGVGLWVASGRGLRNGDEVRGHAQAVIVQGLGLFVLDGVAWLGHRERMRTLREWFDRAEAAVSPEGGIEVRLRPKQRPLPGERHGDGGSAARRPLKK
ncbi:MAG: hypothetical protein EA421_04315 [Gemmatimonadales bacterium]|nr:MAG: hypothetical protein EA421_04315 [Gemmatimonadales bacterium]